MWAIIRQVLQLLILKICLQMTISFKEPILKSSLPLLTLFKLSASSTIHGVRDRWTGPSKIPKGVYILHFKYTNYQYWCMESAEMFFLGLQIHLRVKRADMQKQGRGTQKTDLHWPLTRSLKCWPHSWWEMLICAEPDILSTLYLSVFSEGHIVPGSLWDITSISGVWHKNWFSRVSRPWNH